MIDLLFLLTFCRSFRSSPRIPAETIGLDKMANTVYREKRQKWSYDTERKEKDGVSISYCKQYLRAQPRNSSCCDCSSCKHGRVGVSPLGHLWQHVHRTRRAPRSQAEQERAPAELPEPCQAAAACLQEMELEQASLSCWTWAHLTAHRGRHTRCVCRSTSR